MRRVAVTGLGAVTPLGNDAPSTWQAAVEGRSGIDFIRAFDPSEYPVRIAAEVKDFDEAAVVGPKDARKLDRNVILAVAAAREALADSGLEIDDPSRVGVVLGSAIGGLIGIAGQHSALLERGPGRVAPRVIPSVLAHTASRPIAIDLGVPGGHLAPV